MTFLDPSASTTEEEHACGVCGFEGVVEVQINPRQCRAWWCCPDCPAEHELEYVPDDPDRWRER